MEIKYIEADDGFALLVKDTLDNKALEYSIVIENDKFSSTGDFTVNYDDDVFTDSIIEKHSVDIMSKIVKGIIDENIDENDK